MNAEKTYRAAKMAEQLAKAAEGQPSGSVQEEKGGG
jgi:hypothetical protein